MVFVHEQLVVLYGLNVVQDLLDFVFAFGVRTQRSREEGGFFSNLVEFLLGNFTQIHPDFVFETRNRALGLEFFLIMHKNDLDLVLHIGVHGEPLDIGGFLFEKKSVSQSLHTLLEEGELASQMGLFEIELLVLVDGEVLIENLVEEIQVFGEDFPEGVFVDPLVVLDVESLQQVFGDHFDSPLIILGVGGEDDDLLHEALQVLVVDVVLVSGNQFEGEATSPLDISVDEQLHEGNVVLQLDVVLFPLNRLDDSEMNRVQEARGGHSLKRLLNLDFALFSAQFQEIFPQKHQFL